MGYHSCWAEDESPDGLSRLRPLTMVHLHCSRMTNVHQVYWQLSCFWLAVKWNELLSLWALSLCLRPPASLLSHLQRCESLERGWRISFENVDKKSSCLINCHFRFKQFYSMGKIGSVYCFMLIYGQKKLTSSVTTRGRQSARVKNQSNVKVTNFTSNYWQTSSLILCLLITSSPPSDTWLAVTCQNLPVFTLCSSVAMVLWNSSQVFPL